MNVAKEQVIANRGVLSCFQYPMTIYGESNEEFRVRPSAAALFLVSATQLVLGFQLSAIGIALVDALMAFRAGWEDVIVVYVPFASDPMSPFFVAPPLRALYLLAEPTVACSALTAAFVLVMLWPSGPSLATRLMIHNLALTLITLGVLSLALDETGFTDASVRTPITPLTWRLAIGVAGVVLVILIERRANRLLANVFHADRASERLRLWALRLPVAFGAVAGLAWLNGYPALAWAALATIAITLLEAMIHTVHPGYERIADPLLRTATLLTPAAAIIVVGTSIAIFGMKGANLTSRVIEIETGRGVIHEPVDNLLRKQLRDPASLDKRRNVIRFQGKEYDLDAESVPETDQEND